MSSPYVVISVKYLDVIWTLRCKLVKCSPCSQITYEQAGVKTSSRTTWPTCSLLNNMDNKRTVWKTILSLAKHLIDPRWVITGSVHLYICTAPCWSCLQWPWDRRGEGPDQDVRSAEGDATRGRHKIIIIDDLDSLTEALRRTTDSRKSGKRSKGFVFELLANVQNVQKRGPCESLSISLVGKRKV